VQIYVTASLIDFWR